MRKAIDLRFMKEACGVLKMMKNLHRLGYNVGEKLVRRLMRTMNLLAIYPKPNLSKKHPEHRIYPYLLRGLDIVRTNQVWCIDITYIQLVKGFCYLVAVMDWFSPASDFTERTFDDISCANTFSDKRAIFFLNKDC